MYYSLFEIFSIGIGPSSSHTVGPMKAAKRFVQNLDKQNILTSTTRIEVNLYGSLALTGVGHGTINAIVYGLMGLDAEDVDVEKDYIDELKKSGQLPVNGKHNINFSLDTDFFLDK